MNQFSRQRRRRLPRILFVIFASLWAPVQFLGGQIVGGFNVGFSPYGAMSLANSHVARTGPRLPQSYLGGGGSMYHPFEGVSPYAKPFSSPQFNRATRPLVTSMDMANYEIRRGMLWGGF